MPARHRSRQRALQVLFLWDQRKQDIGDAISSFYETLGLEEDDPQSTPPDEFMEYLGASSRRHLRRNDQRITAKSAHWRIERMPVADRNISRLSQPTR